MFFNILFHFTKSQNIKKFISIDNAYRVKFRDFQLTLLMGLFDV